MQTFYFRTWNNGQRLTHLSSHSDAAICGIDLVGDNIVHDRDPERLEGTNHRVTCAECQLIIATVKAHLTKRVPDRGKAARNFEYVE